MKKLVLATLLSSLICGFVQAEGIYASVTYDKKDKINSSQINNVYGLNVGQKFADGLSVEARVEDERVETYPGQKQEGLYQVKASQDLSKLGMVTPYVAAAVGVKNKSTIDFPFWVAEAGAKIKLNDSIALRYGYRLRTAFDNNATNAYSTHENTLALGYSLTKQDTVTVAAKKERGTSSYNTTGLYYSRSF